MFTRDLSEGQIENIMLAKSDRIPLSEALPSKLIRSHNFIVDGSRGQNWPKAERGGKAPQHGRGRDERLDFRARAVRGAVKN